MVSVLLASVAKVCLIFLGPHTKSSILQRVLLNNHNTVLDKATRGTLEQVII